MKILFFLFLSISSKVLKNTDNSKNNRKLELEDYVDFMIPTIVNEPGRYQMSSLKDIEDFQKFGLKKMTTNLS